MGVRRKPGSGRKPTKKRLARSARKRRAIRNLASYRNADGTRKQTSIEARFAKMLDALGLHYTAEFGVTCGGKYRIYDFHVTDGRFAFLAEIDGEYWHAQKFKDGETPYSKLTRLQRKNVRNDKLKDSIAKRIGVPLLRFREDDVRRNSGAVMEAIAAEVRSQGVEREWRGAVSESLLEDSDENDGKRA